MVYMVYVILHNIMYLGIMYLGIMYLGIMYLGIMYLGIMYLGIVLYTMSTGNEYIIRITFTLSRESYKYCIFMGESLYISKNQP